MGIIVPGEGPRRAMIMLVGQNPGKEEAVQGKPFVGKAGKFLYSVLAKNGIKRGKIYITNIVKETTSRNRKPNAREIQK